MNRRPFVCQMSIDNLLKSRNASLRLWNRRLYFRPIDMTHEKTQVHEQQPNCLFTYRYPTRVEGYPTNSTNFDHVRKSLSNFQIDGFWGFYLPEQNLSGRSKNKEQRCSGGTMDNTEVATEFWWSSQRCKLIVLWVSEHLLFWCRRKCCADAPKSPSHKPRGPSMQAARTMRHCPGELYCCFELGRGER